MVVSVRDVKELALVPVKGTVYVVKLPFVLLSMIVGFVFASLYSIFIAIIRMPLNTARRFGRRLSLTWNWTKSSAQAVLPWKSSSNSASTQTLQDLAEREEVEEPEDCLYYYTGRHHHAQNRSLSRRERKRRRKAIISSLIRVLLDPASPADSEEEAEVPQEESDDDRVFSLIRDLIQFSRSSPRHAHAPQSSEGQSLVDTLRRHASDREQLNNLISELDQYVSDMETQAEVERMRRNTDTGSERKDSGLSLVTPDSACSSPDSEQYTEASEGETIPEDEEEDEYSDTHSALHPGLHQQRRGLSPVAEVSPEAASAAESIESVDNLELELNTALSQLSDLKDELVLEESLLESQQTRITETVTLRTSAPKTLQEEEEAAARRTSTDKESLFEDASEEFPDIPRTSPTLGLQAGHDRRKVATARKTRPPSLPKRNQQVLQDTARDDVSLGKQSSREFEEGISGSSSLEESESDEEGEESGEGHRVRALPHSLSDQFSLLTSSKAEQDPAVSALYASVNKKERKSSSRSSKSASEVENNSSSSISGNLRSRSSSADTPASNLQEKPEREKSLFLQDLVPPWRQMRSRNSSSSVSPATTPSTLTPSHSFAAPTDLSHVPTLAGQSHSTTTDPAPVVFSLHQEGDQEDSSKLYDKLPRVLPAPPIPSRAGQEGIYDVIPYHQQQQQQFHQQQQQQFHQQQQQQQEQSRPRHQYLHERIAAERGGEQPSTGSRSTPPVSWTPQLPPRNSSFRLKRTASAETVTAGAKDQQCGIRRRSSLESTSKKPHGSLAERENERGARQDHPSSESTPKRSHSSSTERDHEKGIRRDRPSSERHHCHQCNHHHRHHHHHRSSSSERHRSSSEKRQSSSDKKHSSSKSSSSSSTKSSSESSGFLFKLLSTPTSSSKKRSTSSSSSSSKKVKEDKDRERKSERKERKHSSSPSKENKPVSESSSKSRTQSQIPRNESGTSLHSGVSMFSSDSSGRESI